MATTTAPPLADLGAIASALRDIGRALVLKGENRFRAGAYERGAMALEAFTGDLDGMIREGRLVEIPGIGKGLAAQIEELRSTGTSAMLRELEAELPPGAIPLAGASGLSLKAIRTLSGSGIQTPEALASAVREGRLKSLPGFSAKTEERLLRELEAKKERGGGLLLADALEIVEGTCAFLRDGTDLEVVAVGDVRRGVEVVHGVDLLAVTVDPRAVLDRFARFPRIAAVETASDTATVARLHEGTTVRLFTCAHASRGTALQRLTGSAAHNEALDEVAARAGLRVDASGVQRGTGAKAGVQRFDSEEPLYRALGLAFVPPLLREGRGEVAEASAPNAHFDLVAAHHIRGMVHCHTVYSDGRDSIEAMARGAEALGMEYITITDHSPTASYANGVETDRLARQWDEIARVQESVKVRILRGTESDILKDGALDYPDSVLEKLDVIVASVHNRYGLDAPAMTERVIRALRHPLFKIWGHALGRLLLKRPPIDVDVEAVLAAAAESRVAIEINGDPHRLDLEPRWARRAKELGIPFVVSVDAHAVEQLGYLRYGVTMAGRAGLRPADVLNARPVGEFLRAVRPLPRA